MLYNTQTNLDKARELIDSGEEEQLYYACLELRYALEKITYSKLRLRLDKITIEEISAWQPRRALDRLMELVDEHLDQDSILKMGPEVEFGVSPPDDQFTTLGRIKGVNPKEIGKHWQKLGSNLHIRMPKDKSELPEKPSSNKLKEYLEEVLEFVQELSNTNIDAHFCPNITFTCSICEQSIVRNANLLKEGDIVRCQNPQCPASYRAHKKGNDFTFEGYVLPITCSECNETEHYHASSFLEMPYTKDFSSTCNKCGTINIVRWDLVRVEQL